MTFAECGSILNTCVLSLTASLGAVIAAFVAYAKAKRAEEKNGS